MADSWLLQFDGPHRTLVACTRASHSRTGSAQEIFFKRTPHPAYYYVPHRSQEILMEHANAALDLHLLDLVTANMDATIAFYRALGVAIPETAIWRTPSGPHHVDITLPGGMQVHFDSAALAKIYNQGWQEPTGAGSRVIIGFRVASRDAVDRTHQRLTNLGHRSAQPPYDAFWGARYAIVEDPDGNYVGIMSPLDPARKGAPPAL
jgi:uncharacterized glyoxalase superfamily protein PhnB